ncbi:MAG: ATP-binding cassette domain-containing protein [Desulfobacterales bacterium]
MASDNILELNRLQKSFGGVVAVSDLSLFVNKGAITSLIGPNGAGKTTIFNLITGFLEPTSGHVRFAGRRLSKVKPHRIAAAGIGRTFQNVQIFPQMSVLENIMVGRHLRSRAGIFILLPCHRFLRKEEKNPASRGEKQLHFWALPNRRTYRPAASRSAVSACWRSQGPWLSGAKLLLLDEPASGLNAGNNCHGGADRKNQTDEYFGAPGGA